MTFGYEIKNGIGNRRRSAMTLAPPVSYGSRTETTVYSLYQGQSNNTRLVSWLESESCGTHPRTKGARFFLRRAPVPITAGPRRGLLMRRRTCPASRDPSRV